MTLKEFADYVALLLDNDVTEVEPSQFLDEIGIPFNGIFNGDDIIYAIQSELTKIGSGSRTEAYEFENFVICVCEGGKDAWKNFCTKYHNTLPHLPEMYEIEYEWQCIYVTRHYDFLENADMYRVNDWSTIRDNEIRVALETLYNSFGYEGSVYTAMVGENKTEFYNHVDTEGVNYAMFTNAIDVLELIYGSNPLLRTLFIGLKYVVDHYDYDDILLDCLPCNLCENDDGTLLLYDMVAY